VERVLIWLNKIINNIENFEKEFGDVGGGGDFDAKFLAADTENDIALIALAARACKA